MIRSKEKGPTDNACEPLSSSGAGQPDSNWRPQPWQGCALPTELCPQRALYGKAGYRSVKVSSVRQLVVAMQISDNQTLTRRLDQPK